MAFNSSNQEIDIRFGEEVLSSDANKKIRDIAGGNGVISGLLISLVSGRNCKIAPGRMIVQGAAIEELADIPFTVPSNAGNPIKTFYIYGFYTHGDGAVLNYDILETTTVAQNAVLIGSIYMPAGATTVTAGNITNATKLRQLVQISTDLVAMQGTVSALNSEMTTEKGKISTLQTNVGTLNSEMTTEKGKISTLQTNVGTLNSEMTTEKGKIVTLQTSVGTLNSEMTTEKGKIVTLQTSVGTLNSEMTTEKGKTSTLQTEMTSVKPLAENAVVWADKATKKSERINIFDIGGALMQVGGTIPTGTTDIKLNAHFTATKLFGATFKDYAEFFERGMETEPGDIIALDANAETERYVKADRFFNNIAVGIHSDNYGFCVGADGENTDEKDWIPVGVAGRLRVKVIGVVQTGDYIGLSCTPGVGISVGKEPGCLGIIGRALESKFEDGIGRVNCLIKNM